MGNLVSIFLKSKVSIRSTASFWTVGAKLIDKGPRKNGVLMGCR